MSQLKIELIHIARLIVRTKQTFPSSLPSYPHRCSYLNQIAVQIIKAYDLLPPAMCHQPVSIFRFRIQLFQFLDKCLNIPFFEIQFTGIIFRNDIFSKEILPDFFVLKHQAFCQNHISFIIQYQIQAK